MNKLSVLKVTPVDVRAFVILFTVNEWKALQWEGGSDSWPIMGRSRSVVPVNKCTRPAGIQYLGQLLEKELQIVDV